MCLIPRASIVFAFKPRAAAAKPTLHYLHSSPNTHRSAHTRHSIPHHLTTCLPTSQIHGHATALTSCTSSSRLLASQPSSACLVSSSPGPPNLVEPRRPERTQEPRAKEQQSCRALFRVESAFCPSPSRASVSPLEDAARFLYLAEICNFREKSSPLYLFFRIQRYSGDY